MYDVCIKLNMSLINPRETERNVKVTENFIHPRLSYVNVFSQLCVRKLFREITIPCPAEKIKIGIVRTRNPKLRCINDVAVTSGKLGHLSVSS